MLVSFWPGHLFWHGTSSTCFAQALNISRCILMYADYCATNSRHLSSIILSGDAREETSMRLSSWRWSNANPNITKSVKICWIRGHGKMLGWWDWDNSTENWDKYQTWVFLQALIGQYHDAGDNLSFFGATLPWKVTRSWFCRHWPPAFHLIEIFM